MGTAIKHPVPDRVKLSFVILDIQALWHSVLSIRGPDVKNYKWRLNPVWHRMLYSCTHMATVGVKGLRRAANINDRISDLFCGAVRLDRSLMPDMIAVDTAWLRPVDSGRSLQTSPHSWKLVWQTQQHYTLSTAITHISLQKWLIQ